MLCESCHQQPATIRLTTIVANEKTEQHLCAACCQKQKQALAGMNNLLASFLQGAVAKNQTATGLRCENCGQTYEQFKKAGLLGCARCYQEFRGPLKPMLERIHGRVHHAGRFPKRVDEESQARQRLVELRRAMDQAVADEDFERAAVLRDEIRAMQPAREGE